jgi:hypothetical protein
MKFLKKNNKHFARLFVIKGALFFSEEIQVEATQS